MTNQKRTPPSPIVSAEPDPVDLLAASLPPVIPDYEPGIEITVSDFMEKTKLSNSSARTWLENEVKAGRWRKRDVKVGKWRVAAFRPVAK